MAQLSSTPLGHPGSFLTVTNLVSTHSGLIHPGPWPPTLLSIQPTITHLEASGKNHMAPTTNGREESIHLFIITRRFVAWDSFTFWWSSSRILAILSCQNGYSLGAKILTRFSSPLEQQHLLWFKKKKNTGKIFEMAPYIMTARNMNFYLEHSFQLSY